MNAPVQLLPRRKASQDEPHRIDVEAVNAKGARALYKKRQQIYPKLVQGRFRTIKWAAMIVLLAIYYVTPWIRWERAGAAPDQAVLVDFEGRRFYFFILELWPQEIYYITGLLILASVGLFLATALVGRVWCGYACPQTVWTDLFIYVERFFEGDRNARIRLDKAPLSLSKLARKSAKHIVWLLIALVTGGAWVFYFADAPTLFADIFTGRADPTVYLFIGLFTFTTYTLAGTMREQVCTYMCPWPRIQAAMTDQDALSVTYRTDRGEPRGPHKKGESWEGRGDCIDCNQCVAACPQGIDIRDGDQLECINCALCIDACDAIMEKIGRPRGLIAYDTHANVARRARGEKAGWRFVRPRTLLYAVVFALVGALMLGALMTRQTVSLDVVRDRNPPFVRLADGSIRNNYLLKIINMDPHARSVDISVEGVAGAHLSMFGRDGESDTLNVEARADSVTTVRVHVTAPAGAAEGPSRVTFDLRDAATEASLAESQAAFVGSEQR
ncbi:MAG: cytochrome c oxidase accessory protein CcoG [Hyphomonadaceae bacterium]